jgi:hypothetical protein
MIDDANHFHQFGPAVDVGRAMFGAAMSSRAPGYPGSMMHDALCDALRDALCVMCAV